MDHQGEDCIAVGSTGTLLSLMGKEMEILQARRSCSVSYNNMNYKKSPSAKDHTALYANNVFGSPASPLMNLPSASIVSSLWSDFKGLLRSPTSIHHSPLIYHNNAHSPLIYHNNALFCKEMLEINEDSGALICNKSPPAQASPLRTHSHSHPSPAKRTYPKKGVSNSQAPAQIKSPSSKEMYPKEVSAAVLYSCPSQKPSRQTYPKEKVAREAISYSTQTFSLNDGCSKKKADYPHGKSALQNCPKERLVAGEADYPNWKSPLHYHSQERSAIACANGKDTQYVHQVTPTGIHDQESSRKGNRPKERPLAGAAAENPNLMQSSKEKPMDAASPNLQYPTYPKAKAMDAVYAMRRRLGSTTSDADSQNGKVLQEEAKGSARTTSNRCSRKREERAICSMQQDECCMQKREERERVQNEYPSMLQKREERECMQGEYTCRQRREERGSCMQEYECCMKKPMLQDMEKEPCTPASSPLNMQSPSFKPSRSFGGRSLPPVSVVDLQCCHTATSRERSSRRLSFTRLSSF